MLAYPLSWAPAAFVVAVIVLLNAYLALIAFAVMGLLVLALVVALIVLGANEVYAFGRRLFQAPTQPTGMPSPRGQKERLGRTVAR